MIELVLVLLAIAAIAAAVIGSSRSKSKPDPSADPHGMQGPADIDLAQRAEQLKEFKELLDSGAITQDEYDEKKRELLNL